MSCTLHKSDRRHIATTYCRNVNIKEYPRRKLSNITRPMAIAKVQETLTLALTSRMRQARAIQTMH
jgi:hypothetical protein